MPLYQAFHALLRITPWMLPVTGCLLVLALCLQLDLVVNESELFERRHHLSALLLPLLLCLFPQGFIPDPAMAGMPFVLWAMRRLWDTQGQQWILGALFDAGMLIGIAALFCFPYVFLVVVLWASLAVMRPFHWREYLLPLIGLCVIFFLAWGVMRVMGSGEWDIVGSLRPTTLTSFPVQHAHWLFNLLRDFIVLAFITAGVFTFTKSYGRGVIREKNTRASYLAFVFASALLAAFGWLINSVVPPIIIAVPLAVFLSWPLLHARKIAWAELGAYGLLALALWVRWM